MFVNDTLETTIRKKRKKGELIVNQTCMQMFNCEYNIFTFLFYVSLLYLTRP